MWCHFAGVAVPDLRLPISELTSKRAEKSVIGAKAWAKRDAADAFCMATYHDDFATKAWSFRTLCALEHMPSVWTT